MQIFNKIQIIDTFFSTNIYQFCFMNITKALRHYREQRHLTQEAVSEKLNMERSNYARLESRGGKNDCRAVTKDC